MTSRPDIGVDERFDELAARLRAARPEPSAALRERVLTIASRPAPAPRRLRFRFPSLSLLAPVAAAAGAVVVAVGVVSSLDRDGSGREEAVATRTQPGTLESAAPEKATDAVGAQRQAEDRSGEAAPPPSTSRLQDYRAELRVRVDSVDELSRATSQAMRTVRSLGGYVVTARFDAPPGEDGDSVLVFRVPVSRVQEAITRLTGLGQLLSQRISLEDLQAPLERQTDAIAELRTRIGSLERALRDRNLSEQERSRLQVELLQARQQLADQLRLRAETLQRGRLAQVSLTLTTRDKAVASPQPPGETEQRLRDAVAALAEILTWLLYVVIVAAPFLVLAAVGAVLGRRWRRRADERLLGRA